jgi:hypothetical protein
MTNMMEISFIPMYKVVGPFLFIVTLALMVWGGFRLIINVCLQVFIIARYCGCVAAFWGSIVPFGRLPLQLHRLGDVRYGRYGW